MKTLNNNNRRSIASCNCLSFKMEDKHKSVCLSVDIGSSSIRCTNFVRTIPEGVHCTYPHCNTKCVGKFAEKVNNVEMILRIVHEVVSKCMVALKREGVLHISSIGFASFCMNLVGLDQDHTICTPLITYATSMPQILPGSCSCVGGYNVMDDREYHSNTGAILDHPSYALVHLKNMPTPLLKKVCYWQSISSLMIGRWTNTKKVPMSYSEASWTGLFNFRTLQWDEKALISCGLSCNGALPPVIDFDEFTYNADVCSVVSWDLPLLPGYEKESSLNVARRYYLAVGDGAAATIGSAGVLTRCIDGTKPSMPLCLTVSYVFSLMLLHTSVSSLAHLLVSYTVICVFDYFCVTPPRLLISTALHPMNPLYYFTTYNG